MAARQSDFYLNEPTDRVWWLHTDMTGEFLFSFDKKKVYNLFEDYPFKLTGEEIEIFNAENPYWAEFFEDRLNEMTRGA